VYSGAFHSTLAPRDNLGRITQKVETVGGVTRTDDYQYDTRGQLLNVARNGDLVSVYDYDDNGNRLSLTNPSTSSVTLGSYDDQDRVLAYGSFEYSFNPNGDLTTKLSTTTNEETTYDYDVRGALLSVVLPDDTTLEYVTDASGRRIAKKVDGIQTQAFLYKDALRIAAEFDGSGNIVSQFAYVHGSHSPDFMVKAGSVYRFIKDQLGSPRVVVNVSTGTIAQVLEYDEFGRVLSDSAPGFQPFGFAGGLYDQHTGLVRFGARDYDAETGRWTAKDPILFGGGDANLHAYVGSDPVNYIDPSGLVLETAWDAASVGYGAYSLTRNLLCGNYGDAAWDALGLGLDVGALLLPFIPAVGAAIVKGARHSDDAAALIQLAKEAKRTGASPEDAKTLLKWAEEYGVNPAHNHIGTDHWVGGDHIRVGPVNHIPVR
jgi:RHS repeat-associated protein